MAAGHMLMGLTLAGMLTLAAALPAEAQTARFDGLWSVLIITEKGTCDRGYRYAVRIKRGHVGHADPLHSSFLIQGRVTSGGSIRVSVSRGKNHASGTGRMKGNSGAGRWRSSKGECAGIWTAEKRGS